MSREIPKPTINDPNRTVYIHDAELPAWERELLERADRDTAVNHPPHYTSHPSGVECITVTEWFPFNVGNAIKYLWRAGEKGDPIQDLEKARWYVDREIQRLRGNA